MRTLANPKTNFLQINDGGMSLLEHQKGRLSNPTPVAAYGRTYTMRSPRFCISSQHGAQEHKFRVIGDLATSLVKPAVGSDDAYFPQDVDAFVAMARLRRAYGPAYLRARSVYFPKRL